MNIDISKHDLKTYEATADYHKKVTTKNQECQQWMDLAIKQLFNFNHFEAICCFRKAIENDSECPMAYWGISYSLGPHYNYMDINEEMYSTALEYSKKANELITKVEVQPWEKDLIEVLKFRYIESMPLEGEAFQKNLQDYRTEFKKLYEKYTDDLDIVSLYCESVMNLRPWMLWKKDGTPHEEAVEVREVLEKALKKGFHLQTFHLYIHLLELSPFMRNTVKYADELAEKSEGLGHLLHMPSHIYIQIGEYKKSIDCNIRGIEADKKVKERIGEDNFFTFYRAHNVAFAAWAAMFIGNYDIAIKYSNELKLIMNDNVLSVHADSLEFFYHFYLHVNVRFGRWDDIINEEINNKKNYELTRVVQYYAKTVAHAVKGNIKEAEENLEKFLKYKVELPEKRILGNNPCQPVLDVGVAMAQGELFYRKGEYEKAFEYLRKSVDLCDNIIYDEPWNWPQPPRHALAALLLEQGHVDESISVYKRDLEIYPENIWSLVGLDECYQKKGLVEERNELKARLDLAKSNSDNYIHSSCFCKKKAL